MANHKKEENDLRIKRCITLSNNEVNDIKRLSGKKSLIEAIRELFKMAEKLMVQNGAK